jgi:hypothetical protein
MKKKHVQAEESLITAENAYARMKNNIENGVIYRDEIVRAMDAMNMSHRFCLKQDKRHLIK